MHSLLFPSPRTPVASAVLSLGLFMPLHQASAQAQTSSVAQAIRFEIAAQPVAAALDQFARQAGLQLALDPTLVQGRQAPALQGPYAVRAGLETLLQGSGLQGRMEGGMLTVQRQIQMSARSLEEITVNANQLGEITEGSGSYTPGSIATATRLVLTPRETPQSVSVITRQKMDDFQLNSIDQVMEHTPGVSVVTYDSERTTYYARGFAINNFQYDGIPMLRDSAYSAGNTLSDTVIYDRIEVLKGASGLLTGSGDPGATINLVRKKPTQDFQGHASVGGGRWGSYRGELDLGGALNAAGNVRGRAVVAQQKKNTQQDHYSRDSTVFYGIVEADLGPRTLLTLGADHQNNKPMGSTWGGIALLDANGNFNDMPRSFNNGARWSRWEQYTRTGFATLEHSFDSGWVAKLQLNRQTNGYDSNLGSAAAGFPNPADGTGTSMWAGKYVGHTTSNAADLYASGPLQLGGREHELVLGASMTNRRWKNQGWWDTGSYDKNIGDYYQWRGNVPMPAWGVAPDFSNDETTRERGLYATARWNLRDDLKLITGGRWSSYVNRAQLLDESGVFVPYLGVVYDFHPTYSAYASYSGIFKPQSVQDAQGHTLDPLEGTNYELGIKAEFWDGKLNASAAVFQLQQDNYAVETGGMTPSGGTAYRAIQGVKTRGYELEVSGQLSPGWQIQAGFSHGIARQQGQRVSTLTPSNQFSLYTSYRLGGRLQGLTLGGGARWQDKTWGDISTPSGTPMKHTVQSYWVLDAMARYEFSKQLSASVSISNLLDKKYYTIFNWYSTYTWGAPRSVNISVNYKF
ncbi:TonB-dependent siderophore receptor [Comamonas composti]|uniref:TonB-dependent siderophore receptor n=1 Tax=Comamonas composti TaxID=408558 RepID=UPI00047D4837|nr:TonB-dependent receptor [Comamonas composti]